MGFAYQLALEPIALPGQVFQLKPENSLREIRAIVPLPWIGPLDVTGSLNAGATDTTEIDMTELEVKQNQIGQFRIMPVSNGLGVDVRETGAQQQMYNAANVIATIEPGTPGNLTDVFIVEDSSIHLKLTNNNTYQLTETNVAFTGFKYQLTDHELGDQELGGRQPIAITVDEIETQGQARVQGSSIQRQRSTAAAEQRGGDR